MAQFTEADLDRVFAGSERIGLCQRKAQRVLGILIGGLDHRTGTGSRRLTAPRDNRVPEARAFQLFLDGLQLRWGLCDHGSPYFVYQETDMQPPLGKKSEARYLYDRFTSGVSQPPAQIAERLWRMMPKVVSDTVEAFPELKAELDFWMNAAEA